MDNHNISIDKAITRGHHMLTYSGVVVMLVLFGLSFVIAAYNEQYVGIIIPVGLCLSIIISWLFWSMMVPRWKVWAFENVRNVHELKRRAINEKLIWKDGSFFNKTEIWNASLKKKWDALQVNFTRKDEYIFEEDITVPFETSIYFSRKKKITGIIAMLICLCAGIFLLATTTHYFFGLALCLMGGIVTVTEFRDANNPHPQIIINEDGIQTASTQFYRWKEIMNEEISFENGTDRTYLYLTYDHTDGHERLQLNDLDIHYKELRRLLKIYRSRHLKRSSLDDAEFRRRRLG